MKNNWRNNSAVIVMLTLLLSGCQRAGTHADHDAYTCPMHPTILRDRPGACPVCGMDLVMKSRAGNSASAPELSKVAQPVNSFVVGNSRGVVPVRADKEMDITVSGVIRPDARRISSIAMRTTGRVERLYTHNEFEFVGKGQRILDYYSVEILAAGNELLHILNAEGRDAPRFASATTRLKLLGVSDEVIARIASTGVVPQTVPVVSPVDGYVLASGTEDIDAGATPGEKPDRLREGMYLRAGQTALTLVNIDAVWVEADISPAALTGISTGTPVKVIGGGDEAPADARIDSEEPFIDGDAHFIKVRAYVSNSRGRFRIGDRVRIVIHRSSGRVLWIPASARAELGTRQVVFRKRAGGFQPKVIHTGRRSGELIEVLSGLQAGDSIAVNAQFMTDADVFIKPAN